MLVLYGTAALAHLSRSDKVSFCDHILSVVNRASVRAFAPKQFLQKASPPKQLIGI